MSRTPKEPPGRPSRLPDRGQQSRDPTVFIPAPETTERPPSRWKRYVLGFLVIAAVVAVVVMVAWPRLNPRKLDPVERIADAYLNALAGEEPESARRFGIVEEPPAIRAVRGFSRVPCSSEDQLLKGSFAPVGKFHKQIESDFVYDPSIGRFTPKNAMGAAAETLDVLHKAKEDAEKSGLYKKMQSGNPEDLFDAAEEYGKVFTKPQPKGPLPFKNPSDLSYARGVGPAAIAEVCEGARTRSGRIDAGLERPAQAVVSEFEGGRPVHL